MSERRALREARFTFSFHLAVARTANATEIMAELFHCQILRQISHRRKEISHAIASL